MVRRTFLPVLFPVLLLAGCAAGGGGSEDTGTPPARDAEGSRTSPARDAADSETRGPAGGSAEGGEMSPQVLAAASGANRFAFDLFRSLASEEGNLLISPYSISSALSMTAAGAAGGTRDEMARVLHFPGDGEEVHAALGEIRESLGRRGEEEGIRLLVANRLWGQAGHAWNERFLALTRERYGAEAAQVDFTREAEEARLRINAWIEEQTNARIPDLLPPGSVNEMTRLVLTNAVYFKGRWASPFDSSRTAPAAFTIAPDRTVQAEMMRQEGSFAIASAGEAQILELPYGGGSSDDPTDSGLSMLVLLPPAGGLAALEQGLTPEALDGWVAGLRRTRVMVGLPRFRFTTGFRLDPALSSLGMTSVFQPGTADLSRMDASGELFLSAVFHKAFVEVNEEGTEAAGATAGVLGITSAPPMFVADRPFLFLIRDRVTGVVLFLGRMADPTA